MLNDSVKEKDPMKVGRFGLGFKSVFHMTGMSCTEIALNYTLDIDCNYLYLVLSLPNVCDAFFSSRESALSSIHVISNFVYFYFLKFLYPVTCDGLNSVFYCMLTWAVPVQLGVSVAQQ